MRPAPRTVLQAAAASYLANCLLGAAVATGVLNTRRCRWVHHALYISTTTVTGLGLTALALDRDPAFWRVIPALGPLVLMPRVRARTPWHAALGLAAAPAYLGGLSAARR